MSPFLAVLIPSMTSVVILLLSVLLYVLSADAASKQVEQLQIIQSRTMSIMRRHAAHRRMLTAIGSHLCLPTLTRADTCTPPAYGRFLVAGPYRTLC